MDTAYGNDSLFDLFLARRKITPAEYQEFDSSTHAPLAHIDEMCVELRGVFERDELIVVLPDFDCDGVMSGIVGMAGLSELGFKVNLFHPNPNKGYGFGADEVDRLVRENPGVACVITCDTGIGEVEGCARLRDHGVRVLVTDHHRETSDMPVRRYAEVVVDPCAVGETYALREICGAHVLWQVLDRYARTYGTPDMIDQIWRLRVFAGIGTVSDLMTLAHENRQLVRDAVSISRLVWSAGDDWFFGELRGCDAYRRAFYGLSVFFDAFSAAGSLSSAKAIDETFFGFYIGPAINSSKRLGHTTDTVFDVFFSGRQRACADEVVRRNAERKQLATSLLDSVLGVTQPYAPYIYLFQANEVGMRGLVASNIASRTGMPTMVVSVSPDDFAVRGSGRAPDWYDCLSKCNAAGFHLSGHEHAFGLYCTDMGELVRLYEFLASDFAQAKAAHDAEMLAAGVDQTRDWDIVIDTSGRGDAALDAGILYDFVETQESYRPFGVGFEAPHALLRFWWDEVNLRFVGSGWEHARIQLAPGIVAMCFRQGPEFPRNLSGQQDYVGTIGTNEFRGETSLQFIGECRFGAKGAGARG